MNERTNQLWKESQQWNGSDDGRGGLKILESVETFAELIVAECIGIVENLSPGYKDYRDQIEDAFRRDCVIEIKQHFGVEE